MIIFLAVISSFLLISAHGLLGALYSVLITSSVYCIGMFIVYYKNFVKGKKNVF